MARFAASFLVAFAAVLSGCFALPPPGYGVTGEATGEALTGEAGISGEASTTGTVATGEVTTGSNTVGCTHSAVFGSEPQLVFGPFDGTNKLSQPGVFTVAMWISPIQVDSVERALISVPTAGDGVFGGWKVSVQAINTPEFLNGVPTVKFGGDGWRGPLDDLIAPITLDAWTHVAVTFDRSRQQLFINGQLHSEADVPVPTDFVLGHAQLVVGGEWPTDSTHNLLELYMNEIGIWHRVLSPAEVALAADGETQQISTAQRFTLAYVSADHVLAYHQDGTLQVIERTFAAVSAVPPRC